MDIVFTPAAILDMLSQITELQEYDIGVTETIDGNLQIQIGDSIYEVKSESAEEVSAPEDVVESIETINEDAYADLVDSGSFEDTQQPVESGLIKEAIKSLLLGGAIKFIKKLL